MKATRSTRPRRPRCSAHARVPPCAPATAAAIASPRPVPPRVRASSARVKRSNARGRNSGGKPAPSSQTCSSTLPLSRAGAQHDRPVAVGQRVVDQVGQRLLDPRGVGVERARPATGSASSGRPSTLRPRLEAPGDAREHLARVERLRAHRQPPLVRARDHQQVLGQAREPLGLLGGRAQRVLELLAGCARRAARARARCAGSPAACAARARRRATNARSRLNATSSRASISFSVRPSRPISSLAGGTGSRSLVSAAVTAAAWRRIRSTGRSAAAASDVADHRGDQQRDRAADRQQRVQRAERALALGQRLADDHDLLRAVRAHGPRQQPHRGAVRASAARRSRRPRAPCASDARSSSDASPAPGRRVDAPCPSASSTCANGSPVLVQRRLPACCAATTAAASPARAASPSSIVLSRFCATSRLSAIPAPVSSTAITPVNASVSLNRSGTAPSAHAHPASGVVGPLAARRGRPRRARSGRRVLREVALLVAQHGGQRPPERAFAGAAARRRSRRRRAASRAPAPCGASSSASATENNPTVNSRSRSSSLRAAAEQLAHAPAQQRERDELVGRLGHRRERHDRRPAPDGAGAEQRQRLAHGVDLAREREEGRVDVAQQRDREADVGADDPLELLEGDASRRGQLARAPAARRPRRRRRARRAGGRRTRPGSARSRAAWQRVNSSAGRRRRSRPARGRARPARRSARAARRRRARRRRP